MCLVLRRRLFARTRLDRLANLLQNASDGRRRRAEKADAGSLRRVPSARTIARLMTAGRDALSKSEAVTIAAVEDGVPLTASRMICARTAIRNSRRSLASGRRSHDRRRPSLHRTAPRHAQGARRRSGGVRRAFSTRSTPTPILRTPTRRMTTRHARTWATMSHHWARRAPSAFPTNAIGLTARTTTARTKASCSRPVAMSEPTAARRRR